jgi:diazepam-binding inhibitor (GABA receptor modulating acyl-CoA-binding protein)
MSDLDAEFAQAQQDVTALANDPGNDAKLTLYALYKQATVGDVSGKKPGMFDMVGKAKYEAWAKVRGLPAEDAKRQYVDYVHELSA